MRIGMIARACNSGLGSMCWEFARHLKPVKVLVVENGIYKPFPERYRGFDHRWTHPHHSISREDEEWITEDVDVLLSIETFYSATVVSRARRKGVKTVLVTMVEMQQEELEDEPDFFLCPSLLDYDVMKAKYGEARATYLPVPIAMDRLDWQKRGVARHFVHTASHGGMHGRKGTWLLMQAMNYVKREDVQLTIYSWKPLVASDSRITVEVKNFKNWWQVWRTGDVLVYPQGANGICLPIVEAMCAGLGVITTDIYPFNEYMPRELLFKPERLIRTRLGGGLIAVDDPVINPVAIAKKIDEVAGTDIGRFSLMGKEYADKHSWEVLLPSYTGYLEKLCAK